MTTIPPSTTPPPAPERVLITGGGGFIGSALARRFRAQGFQVRGLDVSAAAALTYTELDGELTVGDLFDDGDLERSLVDVDVVIHTAAKMGIGDEWDEFRRVNVEGARRVAEASRASGARAMVHLSSVMVYGFGYPDDVTEDGPLDGANNPYCQTKIDSEAAVLDFHEAGSFDVFVIRPGDVYGPGCEPWVRTPIELIKAGHWMSITTDTGSTPIHNHVYVDNLIDGIELVLASGRSGEPFNISDGERTPAASFFGHFGALLDIEVPTISEADARAAGVPDASIGYLARSGRYSIAKARTLGYQPRVGLEQGMAITCAWARDAGLLERKDHE